MGESQGWLFEPTFNRSVKVRASDDRITSDGGLLLLREADHRLGITEWLAGRLHDPRRQDLIRYQLVELLRERVYALAFDGDGTLWLQRQSGLVRYRDRGGRWQAGERVGTAQGMPAVGASGMQVDRGHRVWMSTPPGKTTIPEASMVRIPSPSTASTISSPPRSAGPH